MKLVSFLICNMILVVEDRFATRLANSEKLVAVTSFLVVNMAWTSLVLAYKGIYGFFFCVPFNGNKSISGCRKNAHAATTLCPFCSARFLGRVSIPASLYALIRSLLFLYFFVKQLWCGIRFIFVLLLSCCVRPDTRQPSCCIERGRIRTFSPRRERVYSPPRLAIFAARPYPGVTTIQKLNGLVLFLETPGEVDYLF